MTKEEGSSAFFKSSSVLKLLVSKFCAVEEIEGLIFFSNSREYSLVPPGVLMAVIFPAFSHLRSVSMETLRIFEASPIFTNFADGLFMVNLRPVLPKIYANLLTCIDS